MGGSLSPKNHGVMVQSVWRFCIVFPPSARPKNPFLNLGWRCRQVLPGSACGWSLPVWLVLLTYMVVNSHMVIC